MNESWKELMGFVPLLVAITTALLAFLFGKATEKKKKFYSMVDENLNANLSKMYREVIDITEIQNYDSRKMKKFILKYANDENMYKLHDDDLIYKFLTLSIQVRKGTIDETGLASAFKWLSIDIQNLFWDTLKVSTSDFKWWRNRKTINPLVGIPLNIFFIFKDVFEYLCGLFLFFLFFVLIDIMDGKASNFTKDYGSVVGSLSISFFMIYVCLFTINNFFGDKRDFKRKKIIRKSK
ncbi:hypothetical protein Q0N30_21120 [Priestia megaterium]|uniref:hypothetical protein n=1 Tax=Priestia megaterium TaxID=1404 RepID=UPI003459AAA3